MDSKATVFVVDDDEALRRSLSRLMESVGLPVETYATAQDFLDAYKPDWAGCLLLDLRLPGMNGLDLQEVLAEKHMGIPIIVVSAHGDVEQAVRAMKNGAVDFIRKPYNGQTLLDRIRLAMELDARIREEEARREAIDARLSTLTPREHEVMNILVEGKSSKQIALKLGLSRKTVDIHRLHIMNKLQIDSVVDLVRMVRIHRSDVQADVHSHLRQRSRQPPPDTTA